MTEKFGTFKGSANLTEEEKDAFDDLMRETIKKNSESLELASGLEFSTIEQLQQGASTLKSVVLNTVPGEAIGTMLDMEGRESAVVMMEKMANSFKNHLRRSSSIGEEGAGSADNARGPGYYPLGPQAK